MANRLLTLKEFYDEVAKIFNECFKDLLLQAHGTKSGIVIKRIKSNG